MPKTFKGRFPNLESITNKVTSINEASDDAHYPSAKAVWDAVQKNSGSGGGELTEHGHTIAEVEGLQEALDEIPQALADLTEDSTHRTVTDTEKENWNNKSDFSGKYADLADKPDIPSIDGLATTEYVDQEIKSLEDNKVDKVTGKGLSTEDYSTEEKNKLLSVENGANKYILPVAGTALGGIKSGSHISVDEEGNVTVNDDSHKHTIANVKELEAIIEELRALINEKVPSTRTVNGKALSDDITLTASDVGALPKETVFPSTEGFATKEYVDEQLKSITAGVGFVESEAEMK